MVSVNNEAYWGLKHFTLWSCKRVTTTVHNGGRQTVIKSCPTQSLEIFQMVIGIISIYNLQLLMRKIETGAEDGYTGS